MLITYFLRSLYRELGRDEEIIDLHEWGMQEDDPSPVNCGQQTCKTCDVVVYPEATAGEPVRVPSVFPCQTLRILASEFRNHPLFENRWLPLGRND